METISKGIVALSLLVVSLVVLLDFLWFDHIAPCVMRGTLTEFAKLTYQQLTEMNKYLISLGTLVLGGIGGMAFTGHTIKQAADKREATALVFAAALFGLTSLYFAFVSHVRIADATIANCIEFGTSMEAAQTIQFYSLVLEVVVGIYLALRFMSFERQEKH